MDEVAAEPGSQTHTYALGYGIWRCDHCGSPFVAMAGCGECGKDGPQEDRLVDERRRIVQRVRPLLDAAHQGDPLDVRLFWGDLVGWLDRLYSALVRIGEGRENTEPDLAAVLSELARMRSAASATPRMRPAVALWREVDGLLDALHGVAMANLDALEAATPQEAQGHEREAQEQIDAAAGRARACGRLFRRMGLSMEGSFFDVFARETVDVYQAANAVGLSDFDAKGASLYHRITGGAEFPIGVGVSLMLVQAKVDECFDADRFERDARAAFVAFTAQPQALDALIEDDEWRDRVARATHELFSAGVEAFDLARGSIQNQWFENRTLLRLALGLAEGVVPIYLSTLLALRKRRDWRRYRGRGIGPLLEEAEATGFGQLVEGLDAGVRHADAHRSYEQLKDGIALTDRQGVPGRELSQDELLDLVLAALESCLLLHTALVCAMTARGVPAEDLDIASHLIPRADQLRFLASAAGLAGAAVEERGHILIVKGHGTLTTQQALPTVAALSAVATDDIDHLEVVLTSDDGSEWRAEGPLQPFRAFRTSSGTVQECATIESAASWKIQGQPVFSRNFVRCWSARRVGVALQGAPQVTLQVLDALGQMAERLGDAQLGRTLEAFGRLVRVRRSGLPPSRKDTWSSDQLVQWMNEPGRSGDGGLLTA